MAEYTIAALGSEDEALLHVELTDEEVSVVVRVFDAINKEAWGPPSKYSPVLHLFAGNVGPTWSEAYKCASLTAEPPEARRFYFES